MCQGCARGCVFGNRNGALPCCQNLSDSVTVSMQLIISAVGVSDGQAAASLYRWLSRDATLARYGQVSARTVGERPGDMGAAVDVINAVLADAGAAAGIGSLLVAYRAWRDTRTLAPSFVIEKDGVRVVVNQGSEKEVQQVLNAMLPETSSAGDVITADSSQAAPEDR